MWPKRAIRKPFFQGTSTLGRKRSCTRLGVEGLESRQLLTIVPLLPPNLAIRATADFDRNGSTDFVVQDVNTGDAAIWHMENTTRKGADALAQPGGGWKDYKVVGAGDFTRDGFADLVVEYLPTHDKQIWEMRDAQRLGAAWVDRPSDDVGNYQVVAVGDFNKDGWSDLVVDYKISGDKAIWLMGGLSTDSSGTYRARRLEAVWINRPSDSPTNYEVVAAGDFNRDGWTDLLLDYKPSGDKTIWRMSGTRRVEATWIAPPADSPASYQVLGVGNWNLDGYSDVLIRHRSSGEVGAWLMNGLQRQDAIWIRSLHEHLNWNDGVVWINGTDQADQVVISGSATATCRITINGFPMYFPGAYARRFEARLGAGDDRLENQTTISVLAEGGAGDDALTSWNLGDGLYGEAGNDLLNGSRAFDILAWNDGVFYIEGTAGNDVIQVARETVSTVRMRLWGNGALLAGSWAAPGRVEVKGGDGNDTISNVTDFVMVAYGGAGDDVVTGGRGWDSLWGGAGNDRLYGGDGHDYLYGDDGSDQLFGEGDNDWLYGGAGDDTLSGGNGNDALFGNAGNDQMYGGLGSDSTIQEDSVRYDAATGTVMVVGTDGPEVIQVGDLGADLVVRFGGNEVAFLAAQGLRLARLQIRGLGGNDSIRNDTYLPSLIQGDAGEDTLSGGRAADWIYGGAGDDQLLGNDGNDALFGNAGNDQMYGGLGSDSTIQEDSVTYDPITSTVSVVGTDGPDVIQVGDLGANLVVRFGGNEVAFLAADGLRFTRMQIRGLAGDDSIRNDTYLTSTILGDAGNDTLGGGSAADWIYGGAGDDQLFGNNGDDRLIAGSGSDVSNGGQGNDTYVFEEATSGWETDRVEELAGAAEQGLDFLDFSLTTASLQLDLSVAGVFAWSANRGVLGAGGNFERVRGGLGNDRLYGSPGSERLEGSAGDDTIFGGDGEDYLDGGTGRDVLTGGRGRDMFHDEFDPTQWAVGGMTRDDVQQGTGGTCTILATLAAAAGRPNLGANITYLGNNTFRVRLYNKPFLGLVNRYDDQVVAFDGTWYDHDAQPARQRDTNGTPNGAIVGDFWTTIYQRAVLQHAGVNWRDPQTMENWGWYTDEAHFAILGNAGLMGFGMSLVSAIDIQSRLRRGEVVTVATRSTTGDGIVPSHAYAVLDVYQSSSGQWRMRLYNPWGVDHASAVAGANDGLIDIAWTDPNFVGFCCST